MNQRQKRSDTSRAERKIVPPISFLPTRNKRVRKRSIKERELSRLEESFFLYRDIIIFFFFIRMGFLKGGSLFFRQTYDREGVNTHKQRIAGKKRRSREFHKPLNKWMMTFGPSRHLLPFSVGYASRLIFGPIRRIQYQPSSFGREADLEND